MKTIGLIAGMSWESSESYYRAINEGIREKLGGLHSAQIVMVSVDFAPIEAMQSKGDWAAAADVLIDAAKRLESIGADAIMICTNTMHMVANRVEMSIDVPLLHIADQTASVLLAQGLNTVALLGTAFTMEQGFYKDRLTSSYGLTVLVPNSAERVFIHNVIYQELCMGRVDSGSRSKFLEIIDELAMLGAQGVILGCTEIGLLIKQDDTPVPLFDTTSLHSKAAVDFLVS